MKPAASKVDDQLSGMQQPLGMWMNMLSCFCIVFIKDSVSPRKKAIAILLLPRYFCVYWPALLRSTGSGSSKTPPNDYHTVDRPSSLSMEVQSSTMLFFGRMFTYKRERTSTHKDGVT